MVEREHREREERENLLRERQRLEMERQKLERERLERERIERERVRIEQVLCLSQHMVTIRYTAMCSLHLVKVTLVFLWLLNENTFVKNELIFNVASFRNGVKRQSGWCVNVRSSAGSRNNFVMSKKRETTLKEAVTWNMGIHH